MIIVRLRKYLMTTFQNRLYPDVFIRAILKVILCQAIFYVSLSAEQLPEYSSDLLESAASDQIRTYEYRHLHHLKRSVAPRPIYYIHSGNRSGSGGMAKRGILFTYSDPAARKVQFTGSQNRYRPIDMHRNRYGIWYLVLDPGMYELDKPELKIRYKFKVDSLFVLDDTHESREEIASGSISTYYLTERDIHPMAGTIITRRNLSHGAEVLFRLKAPSAHGVSLLGNFNRWNPAMDVMQKSEDGWFTLKKVLAPGEYVYAFRVDSDIQSDPVNPVQKLHPVFGQVAELKVK